MTRVLYAVWNYPQISETYIEAEIEHALRQGVQVEVWSDLARRDGLSHQCPVHRGTLEQAIAAVNPHVLHTHYLATLETYLKEVPPALAVTVRGHSFDWNPEAARRILRDRRIQKLYLFPHFASQLDDLGDLRVVPMPVAYSSSFYGPEFLKDRTLVLRASAGRPDKGLDDFFAVAALCPGMRFTLCVAEAGGNGGGPEFIKQLKAQAASSGRVELKTEVGRLEMVELTRRAGVYLNTSDPRGHPFGMPISVAESLATGSYVLVRRGRGAAEYLGGVGALYDTVEEAAKLIRDSLQWDVDQMTSSWVAATERGAEFRAERVLKPMVDYWKTLG
jgi:glycosyltransferase involved in cell wall biosynthesis